MPKRASGLTARQVQTMTTPGMFADGGGLYLQVKATGGKTWIYRYQIRGRRRDMGIGSASSDMALSLAEARAKVAGLRLLVAAGTDPLEARQDEPEATVGATFEDGAKDYIAKNAPGWRNPKHRAQWTSTLETYVFPVMGPRPINAIDTDMVLKVLEGIWTAKPETASRVRGRIEAILDYAKARGLRDGDNPARWKGHLDLILPKRAAVARVKHHRALPYKDMAAFWPRLQVQDGAGARALEFLILTAARTGEVLGATWDEVDMEARVWTVPADRMKAGQEHRVPLSDPALSLLRKMAAIRRGDLVFPGAKKGRPLSNMTMTIMLRRMGVDAVPHGFRSTFRTWVADCAAYPFEVAEAALAHAPGDKVVAAYQRGDLFEKRRAMMTEWAAFIGGS